MVQPPLHLIIGNYNTSSWSLRAWLTLRLARLAFIETRIPLRRPETAERIGQHSPSGKLPVLLAEGVPIWDSLAIAEFIAELEPGIWPLDPIARSEARAISAELHSGFADLRRLMPMDIVNRFAPPGRLPRDLTADIRRVMSIWEHCRARFAAQGPFLFGPFSIADAMMAPIATRLVTHGVPLAGAVEDYVDSVMAWPDMVTWCDAAAAEQSEREATGGLEVATLTRPGRVLGAEPSDTPAETPPGQAPSPAEAPTAVAASTAAVSATAEAKPALHTAAADAPATVAIDAALAPEATAIEATAAEETAAEAAALAERARRLKAGHEDATARHPAAETAPDALAAPAAPPRKRLFEKGPISPADGHAPADAAWPFDGPAPHDNRAPLNNQAPLDNQAKPASIAPSTRERSPTAEAAAGDRPHAEGERAPPPAHKLGWLRHAVPTDYFGDAAPDEDDTARQRHAEERSSAQDSGRPPESPRGTPAGPAAGNQAARPTAIKPIGGGIRRRR